MSKTSIGGVFALVAALALGAYWYTAQKQSTSTTAPPSLVAMEGSSAPAGSGVYDSQSATSGGSTAPDVAPSIPASSVTSIDSSVDSIIAGAASESAAVEAENGTESATQFSSTLDSQNVYGE